MDCARDSAYIGKRAIAQFGSSCSRLNRLTRAVEQTGILVAVGGVESWFGFI